MFENTISTHNFTLLYVGHGYVHEYNDTLVALLLKMGHISNLFLKLVQFSHLTLYLDILVIS